MKLQYTYEESDCYSYNPEATFINGAPPTRTEGIPRSWKKGSFAEQDGLDLSSFNVRNRRYNNKTSSVPNSELDDINNWNSGYWATVLVSPKHAVGTRHYWRQVPGQERNQRFMGKSGHMYYPEWESTTELGGDKIVITFKEELPDDVTPIQCGDLEYVPVGSKIYQLTNQGMLHYMYSKGGRMSSYSGRVFDFEYEVDDIMGERLGIWSGDSGTPTFVKDEDNGKLYWLGNKWGGFPMRENDPSVIELSDFLAGATSDARPRGYDFTIAKLSGGTMDFNNDGKIDSADLGHILSAWGTNPKINEYFELHDLNDDGVIGAGDMGEILANWGPTGDKVIFDPDAPDGRTIIEGTRPNDK